MCPNWVVVSDSLSNLTFSNHGLWLIFVTFNIGILCHHSHFHSVLSSKGDWVLLEQARLNLCKWYLINYLFLLLTVIAEPCAFTPVPVVP